VIFGVPRPPEDGIPVPKLVGLVLIKNSVLWIVIYCILSNTFVGW